MYPRTIRYHTAWWLMIWRGLQYRRQGKSKKNWKQVMHNLTLFTTDIGHCQLSSCSEGYKQHGLVSVACSHRTGTFRLQWPGMSQELPVASAFTSALSTGPFVSGACWVGPWVEQATAVAFSCPWACCLPVIFPLGKTT